jgi:hypothetical protein
VGTWIAVASYGLIVIPLLVSDGLRGYAWGIIAAGAIQLVMRGWFMHRLLGGFGFLLHALRAVLPALPGVAAVLAVRLAVDGSEGPGLAVALLALYVAVVGAATWLFERTLLREALGYLRRRRGYPAVS